MSKHTQIVQAQGKPSALKRLAAAVRVYRHGWQALFTPGPGDVKKMPFIWPSFRTGSPLWQLVDFEGYAQDGFERNALIYSAIMYKAKAVGQAPLRAYKGTEDDSEELPPDAPLSKIAAQPNPYMGWTEFMALCDVYLNIAGNSYTYVDRSRANANGGVPTAMWPMRPDRMRIIPMPRNSRAVMGYLYVPESGDLREGVPFLPADMMHVKLPNPLDPLDGLGEGLSPISPMARSGDVDNAITRYLKLFFDRGAMPAGMMTYENPLQDEDVARVRARWNEVYGGVDNWTELLVADSGAKYERLSLGFNEMGFDALDARNESRIAAPFGVPLILIGAKHGLEQAHYAVYEQARKAFWEDTMTWEMGLFETNFRYYLQGDAGQFVAFDYSEVPGLRQDAVQVATISNAAWTGGAITRNEYRRSIGFDATDDGDVYQVNPMMTFVPVGTAPEAMWLPPGPRAQRPSGGGDTEEGAPAADEELASTEGEKALHLETHPKVTSPA